MSPIGIDLWLWPLTEKSGAEADRWAILSADERERADRYVFPQHRSRFIHGRGGLREILALYTGIAPADLRFDLSSFNKPSIANPLPAPLHFNMSHTVELAALGVSGDAELGVDIEYVRLLKEDIAGNYFSPGECEVLRSLPEEQQPKAFFQCWSRKEAYIKASGEGLSIPLDSFDVAFGPGVIPRFLRIDQPQPQNVADWALYPFEPASDVMGAIAVKTEGRPLTIRAAATEQDALAYRQRVNASV